MNRNRILGFFGKENQGQSLVEVAIMLPILIFMLAGLVEVSNLLMTQNRVTTSSRMAAGFGAANYDPNDWDKTAEAMRVVNLNTITETLDLDEPLWDIWQVRILTDAEGDGFTIFTSTHVYGDNQVMTDGEWSTRSSQIQSDVLDALKAECPTPSALGVYECAANMEAVASVPFHNIDTILGLPIWQWVDAQRIRGLTVMRVGRLPESAGCPILPITIRLQQYSVYPTDWGGDDLHDGLFDKKWPSPWSPDPVALFPAPGEWDFPDGNKGAPDPPLYTMIDSSITDTISTTTFTLNVPGIPLDSADHGYVYWAREIGAAGSFGWLAWRDEPGYTSEGALEIALTYPGNFTDKEEGYINGNMDEAGNLPESEYSKLDPPCNVNPGHKKCGNGDDWLDGSHFETAGEWVANSTGNVNANKVREAMEFYVRNPNVPVFLIVYDDNNGETGENLNYHVWDFVKVKILGWKFTTTDKWVVFEFVDWGVECHRPE